MNVLVIISMTCLLLLLIMDFDGPTLGNNASGVINNDIPNYKLFTGTICNDRDDQVPFIINLFSNESGTFGYNIVPGEKGEDPLTCWTIPDFGKGIGNLVGTSASDIIYGKDGLDVLQGREGDDILDGGNNDDVLFGDDGNDDLIGSFGDDQLYGGNEDDMLDGLFGNDYILGGNGKDELYGNQGNDVLKGGLGPDFFDCGDDIDIVLDYNVNEGDSISKNCENTKTH
jgi:Ca2+-binding RTX toxin-like protein